MARVCAVSLTRYGRLQLADPGALGVRAGDLVVLAGTAAPRVVQVRWVSPESDRPIGGLPRLAGLAGPQDVAADRSARRRAAEARSAARRLVAEHGLPMRVVAVEFTPPRPPDLPDGRYLVQFTAPHRVDFRELVRDLARALQSRVELRHVREREHARAVGGVGGCGRPLCCATALGELPPVAVRMTREQGLPVTPDRGSGACGRAMCCLAYEHEAYRDFRAGCPALGVVVDTPDGPAQVVGYQVPADRVVVRLAESGRRATCPRQDCRAARSDGGGQG